MGGELSNFVLLCIGENFYSDGSAMKLILKIQIAVVYTFLYVSIMCALFVLSTQQNELSKVHCF